MEREIVFNLETYCNVDELMQDVIKVISILTQNGYECLFRYDDCGYYILEYQSDNWSLGGPRFVTVTAEEHEKLWNWRDSNNEEN